MNAKLGFATVVSALGGFLFGFDTAVISGTTGFIRSAFALNDATLGFTVSVALIGTVVGSIAVGKPGDLFGRRTMLFACGVLYLVSAIGCAFAGSWDVLLACRFLGGVGIGAASVMAPMYIAEISPARLRGRLVAVTQFNIVAGIVVAFFSNYLLVAAGPDNWRWMFGVMAVPAALFILLLTAVPESPRWLVRKSRTDRAREVLANLGAEDAEAELGAIVNSMREEEGQRATPLFQKKYRFAILCAVLLAVFNQLSGINVIMYYAPMIFERTGLATDAAMLNTVAVGLTNLVFTVVAMFFIDSFGRKTLLLVGAVGMCLSLGGAAFSFFAGGAGGTAILICVIAFIASFAVSQGAVIWVFLSEIFPNSVRAKGQALGSFTHWVMNAAIAWTFPTVLSTLGGGNAFMFFALMMVPFFFFVWRVLPETKGRSLEDLERVVIR